MPFSNKVCMPQFINSRFSGNQIWSMVVSAGSKVRKGGSEAQKHYDTSMSFSPPAGRWSYSLLKFTSLPPKQTEWLLVNLNFPSENFSETAAVRGWTRHWNTGGRRPLSSWSQGTGSERTVYRQGPRWAAALEGHTGLIMTSWCSNEAVKAASCPTLMCFLAVWWTLRTFLVNGWTFLSLLRTPQILA